MMQARLEQDDRTERAPQDPGQARAAPTNAVMKVTMEEAREQVRQLVLTHGFYLREDCDGGVESRSLARLLRA